MNIIYEKRFKKLPILMKQKPCKWPTWYTTAFCLSSRHRNTLHHRKICLKRDAANRLRTAIYSIDEINKIVQRFKLTKQVLFCRLLLCFGNFFHQYLIYSITRSGKWGFLVTRNASWCSNGTWKAIAWCLVGETPMHSNCVSFNYIRIPILDLPT